MSLNIFLKKRTQIVIVDLDYNVFLGDQVEKKIF